MRPNHPLARRSSKRSASLAAAALSACVAAACATAPRVVQDFPPKAHRMAGADVRFEWHLDNVRGEEFVGYQLQVAPDEHFDKLEFDQVVEAPPVKLPLNPGRWFWRVRGRYRTVGERIRETAWSDIQLVGGRYVLRRISFEALSLDAPAAPGAKAPAAPGPSTAKSKAAKGSAKLPRPAKVGKPPRRPGRGPKVVAAHAIRPTMEGVDKLSVAQVRVGGNEDEALTREVVLRLFSTRRFVLLEGALVRMDNGPATEGAQGDEGAQKGDRRFTLDRRQATPMLAPGAVRLERPDAMLMVRINDLDVDPASLPRPPGKAQDRPGFIRFEGGVRVLNATLVMMNSGQVAWTASLYGRQGVSDLTLVEELARRYFR